MKLGQPERKKLATLEYYDSDISVTFVMQAGGQPKSKWDKMNMDSLHVRELGKITLNLRLSLSLSPKSKLKPKP